MKGFTMQNVREQSIWTDIELFAYGQACKKYAEAVTAFEANLSKKPLPKHEGLPNFKKLYAAELKDANKNRRKMRESVAAIATT